MRERNLLPTLHAQLAGRREGRRNHIRRVRLEYDPEGAREEVGRGGGRRGVDGDEVSHDLRRVEVRGVRDDASDADEEVGEVRQ